MRTEARYLGPRAEVGAIRALAGPGSNCLQYGVTNHYLDVGGGGFALATMGSPRLRLRLYESGAYQFGQLELKRQVSDGLTEKQVWPAEQAWDLVVGAMPWLAHVRLATPPTDDALAVLAGPYEETRTAFDALHYVCSLAYRRVSCAGPALRVTADYDFEPAVVGKDEMIVETKGERAPDGDALSALRLRPLAASKFALLRRVAA
jgi:hypothetical protein